MKKDTSKRHRVRRKRGRRTGSLILRILGRTFAAVCMLALLLVIAVVGAVTIICRGPSPAARNIFVSTLMETSAAKFVPRLYFSEEEIDVILAANQVRIPKAVTDTAAVQISATEEPSEEEDTPGIVLENVTGPTFAGKMMIVKDPSRVSIYTIPHFGGGGEQLLAMIEKTDSIAGMNAGGFDDPDGHGKGGIPLGPVIRDGVLVSNQPSSYQTLIGFDKDHILMVGNMSPQEAIGRGMVDGIAFGPALVINGERAPFQNGSLNPRSAIGQRADGAVLLLVIDGRQPGSLGASYQDLCDTFLAYGAVNAANLDGGSSSLLYYQGELLNNSTSLIGLRPIPDAILVSKQ